jgi:hypothetical protein
MVKYVVRLNAEEREQLLALVNTGPAAAAQLLHAWILLKADSGADSRRWTDAESAEALDTSASTVHRVRQAWVDWGWRRRWPASGLLGGSIANSTGSRKPNLSRWRVVLRRKAGRDGHSSSWLTSL